MADSDITARGLLMLRLRPILTTTDWDTLDTPDTLDSPDTSDTMAMDSDTSTARDLLMLKPRLSLTILEDMVLDTGTPDTSDMPESD